MLKSRWVPLVVAAVLVACAWPQPVEAIPPFQAVFTKKYVAGNKNAEFVKAVKAAKCNLCHEGAKKTNRNAYGKELAKLLDKKKDKSDIPKIQKALDTVAGLKTNPDDDKSPTFGDLIKEGKLPGTKVAKTESDAQGAK